MRLGRAVVDQETVDFRIRLSRAEKRSQHIRLFNRPDTLVEEKCIEDPMKRDSWFGLEKETS